ncbi:MurR/RpiR family transcriptional regulator [Nakamurella aerolata]|uniref:MurR/RpiR family transcriptional regulator n=1 Tax=Nakamurella aerolata TaxID=1656892 RepID=A0A849A552_9ACTN|nr:MurR/RpiR family transcriptional regulator [Nakamurella aerolata]NNG34141.1 MurR/RpiR family transcriptional regulator [Nakamurella aerolata]
MAERRSRTSTQRRGQSAATPPPTAEQGRPLLVHLRGLRPTLTPAEERVAALVLDNPAAVSALTISELADRAATSETTVLRFAKRLGLSGYPQLRLALAAASAAATAAAGATPPRGDINASDSLDDILAKVASADAAAITDTANSIDRRALANAAGALAKAGRIDIYGMGASGLVAADLQQKLYRLGFVAFSFNDPHLALTSAALLGRSDVAVGISYSGTTTESVEALRAAAAHGAKSIAISNYPMAPLAAAADISLLTAAREPSERSGATASRMAALLVVDCLYLATAQQHLPRARKAVAATRRAVRGHHTDD